jgi:hypothetical protein
VRVAADAQTLRAGPRAVQHGGGSRADPAVLVAEIALQIVPAVAQAFGVAGQGEVDGVAAVSGVELGAQGGKQVVDPPSLGAR